MVRFERKVQCSHSVNDGGGGGGGGGGDGQGEEEGSRAQQHKNNARATTLVHWKIGGKHHTIDPELLDGVHVEWREPLRHFSSGGRARAVIPIVRSKGHWQRVERYVWLLWAGSTLLLCGERAVLSAP
eukprot:COSAG05_NODE_13090_length_442_cov_0.594752_1_plen_127_part_01